MSFKGTEGKTAADVAVMSVTDQARSSGLKSVVCSVWRQTHLNAQEQVCERTQALEVVHGLGRDNERVLGTNTGATCQLRVPIQLVEGQTLRRMCGATGSSSRNSRKILECTNSRRGHGESVRLAEAQHIGEHIAGTRRRLATRAACMATWQLFFFRKRWKGPEDHGQRKKR